MAIKRTPLVLTARALDYTKWKSMVPLTTVMSAELRIKNLGWQIGIALKDAQWWLDPALLGA